MNERWVDGFNVIHRLPALVELLDRDPEECRERFLRLLAPLALRSGEHWTVVFDSPRSGRARAAGPIDLVFTHDADAWIISRLREHPRPTQVSIVSSDEKDIGREARALGARVLSADEFIAALRKSRRGGTRREQEREKPDFVSEDEVEFWLEQFGGSADGTENES